jgi:hypothetical protein
MQREQETMMAQDVNPMSHRSDDDTFRPALRSHPNHAEGTLTRVIEHQTGKVPSSVFLVGAFAAMIASASLELMGKSRYSRFVGMWAPTLLIAGVYNKLVKTLGTS